MLLIIHKAHNLTFKMIFLFLHVFLSLSCRDFGGADYCSQTKKQEKQKQKRWITDFHIFLGTSVYSKAYLILL